MKNVFTFLLLVFCISNSVSQISFVDKTAKDIRLVGKVQPIGMIWAKLETNNNLWILTYDYGIIGSKGFIGGPSTREVTFNASKEDIDTLYKLFMGAFEAQDPKRYRVEVNIGTSKSLIVICGYKSMGVKSVFITGNHIGQSSYMTKKQIQKLFGKI